MKAEEEEPTASVISTTTAVPVPCRCRRSSRSPCRCRRPSCSPCRCLRPSCSSCRCLRPSCSPCRCRRASCRPCRFGRPSCSLASDAVPIPALAVAGNLCLRRRASSSPFAVSICPLTTPRPYLPSCNFSRCCRPSERLLLLLLLCLSSCLHNFYI